jgi:hypothetical protein
VVVVVVCSITRIVMKMRITMMKMNYCGWFKDKRKKLCHMLRMLCIAYETKAID